MFAYYTIQRMSTNVNYLNTGRLIKIIKLRIFTYLENDLKYLLSEKRKWM